ncbi:sulfite exporter TauE/SafE family protein [Sphingomicrobium sp. XHP0239]|uniref:sulfite exporter TauE/SafE family protein n=1 Tax=Sphingomicrobium maritimum TaxID=3133972 RepID=UPI0031CCD3CC
MSVAELAVAFFITAFFYSSVGFGGGSTYNALLVLAGLPLRQVPVIALLCNILVVSMGSRQFAAAGAFEWRRFWPLALLSIPAAWLGGYVSLPGWLFVGLLSGALFIAGVAMLYRPLETVTDRRRGEGRAADLASGAGLGFMAGLTGIGGGIFLSPLLHLRRWGGARLIAGTCAAFILVNSLSGLAGQVAKGLPFSSSAELLGYWPLGLAVLAGGWIGSRTGATRLKDSHLRAISAILILYVAVRLGARVPAEWARP